MAAVATQDRASTRDSLLRLLTSDDPERRSQGVEVYKSLGADGAAMLAPWRPVRLRTLEETCEALKAAGVDAEVKQPSPEPHRSFGLPRNIRSLRYELTIGFSAYNAYLDGRTWDLEWHSGGDLSMSWGPSQPADAGTVYLWDGQRLTVGGSHLQAHPLMLEAV